MLDTRNRLLTVPEFATALGVTQAGVRKWLLERRICSVKIGRLVRIPNGELQRLIEEGMRPRREAQR